MSAVPEITAAEVPRVQADLFCFRCGYNLRTLPADGVCAECGTSVAVSIDYHARHGFDPKPARRIRRGLALVLSALGILVGAGASEAIFGRKAEPALPLLFAAALAAVVWGILLSTGDAGRGRPRSKFAIAARILLIFWLLQALLGWWLPSPARLPAAQTSLVRLWYDLLGVPTMLALVILAYGWHLAGIAAALPRRWLARGMATFTALLGFGLILSAGLFAVYFTTMSASGPTAPAWLAFAATAWRVLSLFGGFAWIASVAVLFVAMRKWAVPSAGGGMAAPPT